jgi:hypothetical protein
MKDFLKMLAGCAVLSLLLATLYGAYDKAIQREYKCGYDDAMDRTTIEIVPLDGKPRRIAAPWMIDHFNASEVFATCDNQRAPAIEDTFDCEMEALRYEMEQLHKERMDYLHLRLAKAMRDRAIVDAEAEMWERQTKVNAEANAAIQRAFEVLIRADELFPGKKVEVGK